MNEAGILHAAAMIKLRDQLAIAPEYRTPHDSSHFRIGQSSVCLDIELTPDMTVAVLEFLTDYATQELIGIDSPAD